MPCHAASQFRSSLATGASGQSATADLKAGSAVTSSACAMLSIRVMAAFTCASPIDCSAAPAAMVAMIFWRSDTAATIRPKASPVSPTRLVAWWTCSDEVRAKADGLGLAHVSPDQPPNSRHETLASTALKQRLAAADRLQGLGQLALLNRPRAKIKTSPDPIPDELGELRSSLLTSSRLTLGLSGVDDPELGSTLITAVARPDDSTSPRPHDITVLACSREVHAIPSPVQAVDSAADLPKVGFSGMGAARIALCGVSTGWLWDRSARDWWSL